MPPISVIASGMVTAVGFNSNSTCAAIRAGISGIREDNIWDPSAGEYMGVGRPRVHQWWEGPDMLAELAAPAIRECLVASAKVSDLNQVPIFVLLAPLDRPYRNPDFDEIVQTELAHRLQLKNDSNIKVLNQGRTGILTAIQQAGSLLIEHKAPCAVIVGVDTFLRQRVVEAYMDKRRVLTADNSNGFIPGEAACAVLISTQKRVGSGRLQILGWGTGREGYDIDGETPITGDGLTQAVREALNSAGLTMAETNYWLTDQNGEHSKVKECTITQIRLERRDQPAPVPYQIWHPIENLGEIGTAIAPCLLGLALSASRHGYAPGPLALMHVGDDGGDRIALILQWVADK